MSARVEVFCVGGPYDGQKNYIAADSPSLTITNQSGTRFFRLFRRSDRYVHTKGALLWVGCRWHFDASRFREIIEGNGHRKLLPRFAHRWIAHTFGYFWMPCPICGNHFGGHEWGHGASIKRENGIGQGVCHRRKCRDVARQSWGDE